jgi:bacteriocin biosynthesis cyclodehydratase domain-containing protein
MMIGSLFRQRRQSTQDKPENSDKGKSGQAASAPLVDGRPKLLLDSIFLPTESGIYFRSRQGHFTLDGKQNYEIMTELVPRLTGNQTTSELCAGLAQEKQEPARKLIATLLEKRILINHVEEVTDISPDVLARFAPQLEFIEHFADTPVQRFAKFRRSRILLMGSGVPLRTLALSLARNGLENIVLDTDAPPVERDSDFTAFMEDCSARGIALNVERTNLNGESSRKPGPLNAICYASDVADLEKISHLNERAASNQEYFLPGYLLGGKAFVGPMVRRGGPSCWMCGLLRHSMNIQPGLEAAVWRHYALGHPWDNDGQPASAPLLKILGNLMGFEMFRLFVGHIPIETEGTVLSIDIETLETGTSRLLPHPNCPHCSKDNPEMDRVFLTNARMDTARENLDVSPKLRLTAPLVDPLFGIIRRFDDEDLEQLPLFQSAVVLARPLQTGESTIPGYSLQHNAAARLDAVLSAARVYVASVPNRKRVWVATESRLSQMGSNPLQDSALSNWLGGPPVPADSDTRWMNARSLGLGTMHMVSAGAVYPQTPLNSGYFEKTDAGVGVGFTFRQACGEAVLSLFAHEVLKRIAMREANLFEIPSDTLPDTSVNLQYLRNCFGHLDRTFRMLAFTHEGSGSVVLAFSPDDAGKPERVAVGTAAFFQPAAVAALTDLLALATGGPSTRTVERRLHHSLGYIVDVSALGEPLPLETNSPPQPNDQNMNSVLFAFGGTFTDILIANLTGEDLSHCNLIAVKALFVRSS